MNEPNFPGPIAIFSSGETAPSGRKLFELLFQRIASQPHVAVLETPAGFEPNSEQVAGKITDFLGDHLQNYAPRLAIIPARRRGTAHSPNNPELNAPLLTADIIFLGPGSPTYAARQLSASFAWDALQARHRMGAALAFASAAAIAISRKVLPVYEIYKAGEDLHWKAGLNLLASFGLDLLFIPHWNNNDGGAALDTSRCFMGRARFAQLAAMLPPGQLIVGVDERTGLLLDFATGQCQVVGDGRVVLMHDGHMIEHRGMFALDELGDWRIPAHGEGITPEVWQAALSASAAPPVVAAQPPERVRALVEQRQAARSREDWPAADELRAEIEAAGWQIQDTPAGAQLSLLK